MMEKQKVIQALENCIGCRPCKNCPFDRTIAGITNFPSCMVELQKEALKIIKGGQQPPIDKSNLGG